MGSEPPRRGGTSRRRRAAGAALAAGTLALLLVSVLLPLMEIRSFGRPETKSLVGGIVALHEHGETALAVLLAVFSLLFPIAKLLGLLVATSVHFRGSSQVRRRIHAVADVTGKYSMLDVFVVALLVVVLRIDGMVEIEPRIGTFLFTAAILLSFLAGRLAVPADAPVTPSSKSAMPETGSASPPAPPGGPSDPRTVAPPDPADADAEADSTRRREVRRRTVKSRIMPYKLRVLLPRLIAPRV